MADRQCDWLGLDSGDRHPVRAGHLVGNACYAKAFPIWSGIGSYCTGGGTAPYNGTITANGTTWTLDIDNFQEVPWSCTVTAIGRTV